MSSHEYRLDLSVDRLPLTGRMLVNLLGRMTVGSLTLVDPQGSAMVLGDSSHGLHGVLRIHDWRAAGKILRQGDIGFAESLRLGWLDSPDLLSLFIMALRNEQVSAAVHGQWWALLVKRLTHWVLRDNSRKGSRRNILSHYDLGNDFYQLWLDPSMTYSSAWFQGDDKKDLTLAQDAKYDRILDELGAKPGQTILEVGCGWGGFAERAAKRGINVVGITLSDAQLAFAQKRMQRQQLDGLVELRLQDYRDVTGQFDHVVSIEMFEAVGLRHWPGYFAMLSRSLKPGGKIVVQTIDIADPYFEAYANGTDFIQQYIFPGGMLPSPSRFMECASEAGLKHANVLSFGFDYAETLNRWSQAFEANISAVRSHGFDDPFIRLWRMYLAYCEAGFRERRTDVKQWTLSHAH